MPVCKRCRELLCVPCAEYFGRIELDAAAVVAESKRLAEVRREIAATDPRRTIAEMKVNFGRKTRELDEALARMRERDEVARERIEDLERQNRELQATVDLFSVRELENAAKRRRAAEARDVTW